MSGQEQFIDAPNEYLPNGAEASSFDPVVLRANAEAHNRHPFDHDMQVKAWVVLWLLDQALASFHRSPPDREETVEKMARALNLTAGQLRGLAFKDDWEEITEQERDGWRLCASAAYDALLAC